MIKSILRRSDDYLDGVKARPEGIYWFGKDRRLRRLNAKTGFTEEKVPIAPPPVRKPNFNDSDMSVNDEIAYAGEGRIWITSGMGPKATTLLTPEGSYPSENRYPRFSPTGEYIAFTRDRWEGNKLQGELVILKRDPEGRR